MRPDLKRKFLIAVIGFLIILSLNFYRENAKNTFYLASAPIQKLFWRAGMKIAYFFETISEIRNLKRGNEELKLKNLELLAETASLKELGKENEALREALGIGLEEDFELIAAELIGKDISQDFILINKGLKDGVSEGLPVITSSKVLLGKINEVYKNFSRITLISHKISSFDVKTADNQISGLAKGQGNSKILLDLIPQEKEIREGEVLITGSFGGNYPEGLLVGAVGKIKKSDILPFQQAEISPFFNINKLDTIFIIANFNPRD